MFNSLRSRLWLSYALLTGAVILMISLTLILYLIQNPTQTRLELQRLRQAANILQQRNNALDLSFSDLAASNLDGIAARADQALEARMILVDGIGNVMVDSRQDQSPALRNLPLLVQRANRLNPFIRDIQGGSWLYASRLLENGATLIVAVPRPQAPVLGIVRDEFFRPILRATAMALGLSLLLAIWMASWVVSPLQRMAAAVRKFPSNNPHFTYEPLPIEGPVEVQTLGQAFNVMVAGVQTNQQAQRDFVANVSHELKTPLTSIQGFAQAIVDGTIENPQEIQQAASVIFAESERMYRLVLDLLDLTRLESGMIQLDKQPVALDELLNSAIEKFRPIAENAGVRIVSRVERVPSIEADPDRLTQVISNLIENAIKYSPAGSLVNLSCSSAGDWVEVAVADSGPGIPVEDLDRIFERFYQIEKSRSREMDHGAGLGLAISQEIVSAHGGSITAANQPTQGSIFMVKIPVTKSASRR